MKKIDEFQGNMICQISNLIGVLSKINKNLENLHIEIEKLGYQTSELKFEIFKIKNNK